LSGLFASPATGEGGKRTGFLDIIKGLYEDIKK
jgi:hypothetical protein